MKERLQQLQQEALTALQQAGDLTALQNVRVEILGKKGSLTEVMKGMRDLSAKERPVIGSLVNVLKGVFEKSFSSRQLELKQQEIASKLAAKLKDLVIEAAFEDLGVKQSIFSSLDRHCKAEAILATNTS